MPYRYFASASPVFFKPPNQEWFDSYQDFVNDQFEFSPSFYTIEEEKTFASGSFVNVDVRINKAIDSATGDKLGDDWKLVLFKDLNHATDLGWKYLFDNNYWIVFNTEILKSFTTTCTIRRCNNELRWVDENGIVYTEPCVIDYHAKRPTDSMFGSNPVIPEGFILIYCQINDKTKLIKPNQRFLFGTPNNRFCFKVFGNGVRNYLNQETLDDDSPTMLELNLGENFVNEDTDDLANGIADYINVTYGITISPSAIHGNVSDTFLLSTIVTLDGNPVFRDVGFSSSSPIVSISGSIVTLTAVGSGSITGSLVSNPLIYTSVPVIVSSSPVVSEEIRVTPAPDYIYQGDKQTYSVYRYEDGSQQADTFTFNIANSDVPPAYYIFTTIGANSFSIENLHLYMNDPLVINCTTGSLTRQLSIYLKGGW